jgi:hypothetical protein
MDKSIQFTIFEFSNICIITITLINFKTIKYIEFPINYFLFLKKIIDKINIKNILNIIYYNDQYQLYIVNCNLEINKFLYDYNDIKKVTHCICNLDNKNNEYKFVEIRPFLYKEMEMLNNFKLNIEKNIKNIKIQYINL